MVRGRKSQWFAPSRQPLACRAHVHVVGRPLNILPLGPEKEAGMKRTPRTILALFSVAVIALIATSQGAFARDECKACGCSEWHCQMMCGGTIIGACEFDPCDEGEWSSDYQAPCSA